jgi:hypothetical protein
MFEKEQLTVGDWFLFHLIFAIPGVNIIVFVILLAGSNTNATLKSYMITNIIISAITIFLFATIFASIFAEFLYLLS